MHLTLFGVDRGQANYYLNNYEKIHLIISLS